MIGLLPQGQLDAGTNPAPRCPRLFAPPPGSTRSAVRPGVLRALLATVLVAVVQPAGGQTVADRAPEPTQAPADRGLTRVTIKPGADQPEVELYEGSHALVVAVGSYRAGWPQLPGAVADAAAVEAELERHGFQVETVKDPTFSLFEASLRQFVSRRAQGPRDRVLLYFAGHGYTDRTPDGRESGYLVFADTPRPDEDRGAFLERALTMDQIEATARRIGARHALFVFDSCFSGSLFTVRSGVPDAISARVAEPVRQFITAGTDTQVVPDKSVFREMFVRALEGEADLNDDGYVTGSELGTFLQDEVTNYTRRAQTPQWGKIRDPQLDRGDTVFEVDPGRRARSPREPSAPAARASEVAEGLTFAMPPSGAADEELRELLRGYRDAYQTRDVDGMKDVWPSADRLRLQTLFRDADRIRVSMACGAVDMTDEASPHVDCMVTMDIQYRRRGNVSPMPVPQRFVFRKSGARWVLARIE